MRTTAMTLARRLLIGAATMLAMIGVTPAGAAAQEHGTTTSRTKAGLYVLRIVEPGYDVTITELERSARYSLIEMRGTLPTVTAGGVVMARATYDIARERGMEYTFGIPIGPGTSVRGPEGRRVLNVTKVFMTKDAKTSPKALLGADYSQQAQAIFDRLGYRSISQLAILFGARSQAVPAK